MKTFTSYQLKVILDKKHLATELFDGVCYVCRRKYGKGFQYHHLEYIKGEKVYKDFTNTYDYNAYLIPIIRKDPGRFRLLCKTHHGFFEKKLRKMKMLNFLRLLMLKIDTKD